ncbi:condensation domain-containing protein [Lentzea aerocolonigenes]|uniref:condensation domain-containing protein n=1 Tax=Lentzea aerocolonigenes TaxID=68170 RepID=UPI000696E18E|nr:condensation domain-containing protein [Lentzea aerocolonigenes]
MTGYDVRKKLEAALRSRAAEARTEHPLSFAQRPLLLLHRMNPGSASYNVGFTARFAGGFDPAALHRATGSLVGRHAALRTTFTLDGQTVHGWLEPSFAEVDARQWSAERVDEEVRAAYLEPFDLAAGPLVRVRVFAVAEGEGVVLLTVHHVVCDFWSLGVIVAELEQLYLAEAERRPAQLAAGNVPYSDFVTRQRSMIDGPQGGAARSYWHERLSGRHEPVRWPRFETDPAATEGASVVFPITTDVSDGVVALAKAEGATPYAVLLTAFQILVGRYTGRRDVLVGSPFAGRTDPSLAECVGNFVNPVVLRADLGDGVSFREQLGRTRSAVVEALQHHEYPFELLVSELAPRRVDDRNPIFQAMFSYQKPARYPALAGLYIADEDAADVPWAGLTARPYRLDQQDDQLELVLEVVHDGDRLVGLLKYRKAVFTDAAARDVITNYLALLRAALAEPGLGVADLPMPVAVEADSGTRRAPAAGTARSAAPIALERRVLAVWKEVLGREAIGSDDNFFDLGGNSMLLMRVHELLADDAAEAPLTVNELFRYPTPASLARRLGQTTATAAAGRDRASSRRVQLAEGTARGARLRARQRSGAEGSRDV